LQTYLIFSIAFVAIVMVFLGAICSANGGSSPVAPGQIIEDHFILGGEETYDISITAPTLPPNLNLIPGSDPNNWQGDLIVDPAEGVYHWDVFVSADTNGGCMAEYDPANSQYVAGGKKLQNSMVVSTIEGNTVDLSQVGALIGGGGGQDVYTIPVTFEQAVSWQDTPLRNGNVYRIIVSFIGSASFLV
jgi:hypothetical protein